jgi:hypothetical protein
MSVSLTGDEDGTEPESDKRSLSEDHGEGSPLTVTVGKVQVHHRPPTGAVVLAALSSRGETRQ